jgi:hypothetical protein
MSIPRLHLFEWEDQSWFPAWLRDPMTDYLAYTAKQFDLYRNVPPLLLRLLPKASQRSIVDLGAGGGGGWLSLAPRLMEAAPDLSITLTDYHPNLDALQSTSQQLPGVSYEASSVDARDVPQNLHGLRTQFLSLHHFRPADATAIMANAVQSGEPIAFFEAQERTVKNLIGMLLVPIMVWVFTPFIRPVTPLRLLFTYLIPLLPLLILFDGIVSVLRCYTPAELQAMARQADPDERYRWEAEQLTAGPARVLAFYGAPSPD